MSARSTSTNGNDSDRLEEASRWVLQLNDGIAVQEQAAFDAWRADPANEEALSRASRMWEMTAAGDHPVLADARAGALARLHNRTRRRNLFRYAAALLIAVGLSVGAMVMFRHSPAPPLYAAGSAARDIALSDGTHILLGAGAEVRVAYADDHRKVILNQGSARFVVAHDAERPFRVEANTFVVNDIGTTFEIRTAGNHAVVRLVAGTVDVAASMNRSRDEERVTRRLHPGQQVEIDSGIIGTPYDLREPPPPIWGTATLDFSNVTLAQAIARMNVYADTPITLNDPAAARLRISGAFTAGDSAGFAEGLTKLYQLRSERRNNQIVILSARPD